MAFYVENLVANPLGTLREEGPTEPIKRQDADTTSSREVPACKMPETGCILCICPGFALFPYAFASDMMLKPAV